jgi:hypothetical protein
MLSLGVAKNQLQHTQKQTIKPNAESKKTIGSKKDFLDLLKKATEQEPFDKKKDKK